MQIKNGNMFTQNNFFEPHDLILAGDRITRIAPSGLDTKEEEVLDAAGCYVVPGMSNPYHGSAGCDFCDGTVESVDTIAAFLARRGVTSFLGTSMALPEQDLTGVFKTAAPLVNADRGGAVLRGINMEGPFFSKAKKGAQAEKNIIDPDIDMFDRLYEASGGAVRLVMLSRSAGREPNLSPMLPPSGYRWPTPTRIMRSPKAAFLTVADQ